ncbi:MAG: type I DNA topoisomerase [Deltaproteobacteria bacterium]|jgi:DNA topoisomerase-1|nr:type I DNA topoisomerase [Deltaproteobacteria bacterium]
MKLFIVESPGKIKKIQQCLGSDWRVAASVGHIRDLPVKETGVSPPDFKPHYVLTERGRKVVDDLKGLADRAESVWLATDCDREGEAIAWHIQQSLALEDPRRVTYTEITEPAIKKAIERPGRIDLNLVRAQEGRRVLDRLVGYTVSPIVCQAAGKVLSAGRVQSPALRLVVEREQAIRAFVSTVHYGVELKYGVDDCLVKEAATGPGAAATDGSGAPSSSGVVLTEPVQKAQNSSEEPGGEALSGPQFWKAVWNNKNWLPAGQEYFTDKTAAEKIAALPIQSVSSYEQGQSRQAPPPPFTTSTLQQAASNILKLDPKKTMEVAQKLYEDGFITYMRTDNPNISQEAAEDVRKLAEEKNWPLPKTPRNFKAKQGAQEAHEAIRPTDVRLESAGNSDLERDLYDLVRKRTLASQLDDASFATAKAVLKSQLDGREVVFEAKGRRLVSPGWKIVSGVDQANEADKDKDSEEFNNPVPKLSAGLQVQAASGEVKTKKTVPPLRYTQAALIRELEKRGIGRPSTYAPILDNIASRAYVTTNKKRQLEATGLGEELISRLSDRFQFLDFEYTRNLEEKLDDIAKGNSEYLAVVSETFGIIDSEVKAFVRNSGLTCPVCGQMIRHLVREGEGGYNFWACSDRDNCGAKFKDQDGTRGERIATKELTDHQCPDCGQPLRHIVKEGEGGYDFWACSDRETCGAKFRDQDGAPGERQGSGYDLSDFNCPDCGQPLRHIVKAGEGGYNFWACSDRETCGAKFRDKGGEPGERQGSGYGLTDFKCAECGQPLRHIVKTGEGGYNFWACSDRETCGAKYRDQGGEPGERQGAGYGLTDFKCADCGQPLRHIVKEGEGGYDFWACSDRETCGAKYRDQNGEPGERQGARRALTDFKCAECGQPLRHIVKEGEGGYNFWACSDRETCGAKYQDQGGEPGERQGARYGLTDFKCAECGQPLRHIVKEGEGGYNFWACSDRETCGAKYQDQGGEPGERQGPRYGLTDFKCADCGQPLRHIVKEGEGGYDFWACSDRETCGAKFKNQDGAPGERQVRYELSEYGCLVCGRPLRHVVKKGEGGYNFWGCSNRSCNATYRDDDGEPGEQTLRKPKQPPSEHQCPNCRTPLYHRKGVSQRNGREYDFFSCPNGSCRATFPARDGKPLV